MSEGKWQHGKDDRVEGSDVPGTERGRGVYRTARADVPDLRSLRDDSHMCGLLGRIVPGAIPPLLPAVAGALHELLTRFQRVMLPGGPLLNKVPLPSTLRVRAAIASIVSRLSITTKRQGWLFSCEGARPAASSSRR